MNLNIILIRNLSIMDFGSFLDLFLERLAPTPRICILGDKLEDDFPFPFLGIN